MFEKLILSDAYKHTFSSILLKYNYISLPEEMKVIGSDFLIEGGIRRVGRQKYDDMILNIYQMALLFDEFILYDFSEEPQMFDGELRQNDFIPTTLIKGSIYDKTEQPDSLYIEEYIKPILKKTLQKYGFDSFSETTANYILDVILSHNTQLLYHIFPGLEWIEWENIILSKAHDIQDLHELSATYESSLLSLDYNFSNTQAECTALNNYALIRISYEKVISKLPQINNAHEVLALRKTKKVEIRNFREVMQEFDQVIKTEGTNNAVQKLTKDLNKVTSELAKGNPVSKVARWANLLLVPVSVVEQLLDLPPIGLGINVVAWFADNYMQKKDKSKKWCELIR